MIKAKYIGSNGRTMVVLGLERTNIERLMNNEPILIKQKDLQLDHDIIVLGGETLDEIKDDMRAMGLKL